jgi:MFS transporter, OFA family, oxalate/formate antiporter
VSTQMSERLPASISEMTREFNSGFPVLLTSMFGNAVGINLCVYSVPYFMPSFQQEFGWSRSVVGIAVSFLTAGIFLCAPLVGRLSDRFGARRVTLVSIVLFAVGLAAMALVQRSIWTLYLGFLGLAFLGSGTLYVSYSRAINTWFDRARGLALGLTTSGTGIAVMLLPLSLPPVIERWGWRAGFLCLGIAAASVLPLALSFLRERSSDLRPLAAPGMGLPFSEVLRSRRFWTMLIGTTCLTTAISGSVIHLIPMFTDMGAPRRAAELAGSYFGISTIAGRLIVGPLLDRLPGNVVALGVFLLPAAGYLVPGVVGFAAAPFYAAAIGFALGSDTDLGAFLASRYFGLRAFAESYGWLYAAGSLGYVLGPLLAGVLFTKFGNYDVARPTWAALSLAAALLFLSLGRYPYSAALGLGEATA